MFKTNCVALACVAALYAPVSAAADTPTFNLYGDIQAQAIWQSNASSTFDAEAKQANLGVKGKYAMENLKVFYKVSAQYSDNFDDIEVRNANMYFSTNYGGFFIGKGESGTYKDVYKRTDIHANNNNDPSGKNRMLYEQGKYADNILCYVTPKWSGDFGTVFGKTAIITMQDQNDSSDDILMGRLLYSKGEFNAVANYLRIDEEVGPASADNTYDRYSFGMDYSLGNLTLAGVIEATDNSFNGAENTYVGAASYVFDKWEFGLSYQQKTFEDEKNLDDLGLAIASVKYHYAKHLTLYVEAAEFTEDTAEYASFSGDRYADSDDNLAIGAILKF